MEQVKVGDQVICELKNNMGKITSFTGRILFVDGKMVLVQKRNRRVVWQHISNLRKYEMHEMEMNTEERNRRRENYFQATGIDVGRE